MDVVNKEMVTNNRYQNPIMKNGGQKITLQKSIMKMKLFENDYKRAIIKSCYERTITTESRYNQNEKWLQPFLTITQKWLKLFPKIT
jgi:hypothetical protein